MRTAGKTQLTVRSYGIFCSPNAIDFPLTCENSGRAVWTHVHVVCQLSFNANPLTFTCRGLLHLTRQTSKCCEVNKHKTPEQTGK